MSVVSWWKSRLRVIDRGKSYIRLYPNPGFQLRFPFLPRIYWSQARGWKVLRVE